MCGALPPLRHCSHALRPAGEVEYTVYRDASGAVVPEDATGAVGTRVSESEVEKRGDGWVCPPGICKRQSSLRHDQDGNIILAAFVFHSYVLKADPSVRVSARSHKMSKSRGNVVSVAESHRQSDSDLSSDACKAT